MWLNNQADKTVWVDFGWLPAINPEVTTPSLRTAVTALEGALLELFGANVWDPGEGGGGLVFPLKLGSLQRAHTEPRTVKVGYATCDGNLVGAIVIHLDDAIKPYAHGSVSWVRQRLEVRSVAFVRSLCVSEHLRGFGIGRALLVQGRQLVTELGAGAIVGHLRVAPERDERLGRAYRDAGFTTQGEQITTTILRATTGWEDLFSRETPVDPAAMADAMRLQFGYVPVAALCTPTVRPQPTSPSGMRTATVAAPC